MSWVSTPTGIVRELLPTQPLAAAAAGLLVAFQPMFGFISGAVNNDNGINAAAALALYLMIRGLRRGLTWRLALVLGAVLASVPLLKETGYELYPVAIFALAGIAWRQRRALDPRPWAALVAAFATVRGGWALLQQVFYPSVAGHPGGAGGVEEALRAALADGLGLAPETAFAPIEVAVTGRRNGPPLAGSMALLGRERSLARLAAAQAALPS